MSNPVTYFSVELKRETMLREVFTDEPFLSPQTMYRLFAYMECFDREHNVIAMFDTQKRLIGLHTVSIGAMDATLCSAREIFTVLVVAKAHTWAIAHNHPSGSVRPSGADNRTTENLAAAGQIMGIPLIEHIIVGEGGVYYAYSESDANRLNPNVQVGERKPRRKVRRARRG